MGTIDDNSSEPVSVELTRSEWTVIAGAILKDVKDPNGWHFINKPIAVQILEKIAAACGGSISRLDLADIRPGG